MKKSSFQLQQAINATPQEAWEIIGAVSGVDKWLAPITDCRVEGNKRICTTEGGSFTEDILNVDHENMIFEYGIPSQHMVPVSDIMGSMQVAADESGQAAITWTWDYLVTDENETAAKEAFQMVGGMGIAGIEALIRSNSTSN